MILKHENWVLNHHKPNFKGFRLVKLFCISYHTYIRNKFISERFDTSLKVVEKAEG